MNKCNTGEYHSKNKLTNAHKLVNTLSIIALIDLFVINYFST